MNVLLLVDGNALVHRAYHALPFFKTHEGINTNAVYGFASMLLKTIEDFKPTHVIVCFDRPEPTFRKELLVSYQAHRPKMDDELSSQFPLVKEFLESAKIPVFEKAGYEADDVIGTVSRIADNQEFRTLILTGDRDIVQLVNGRTNVIAPQKGFTEIMIYDTERTVNKFGVKPSQIPDLKGLMGDPSDNYKGVPGIGPKTALKLLTKFKTIEGIYENIDEIEDKRVQTLLTKHYKDALLSKKLAIIIRDVPLDISLESCMLEAYNHTLREFFEKMQFNSLLRRFFDGKKESVKTKVDKKKEQDQLGLF